MRKSLITTLSLIFLIISACQMDGGIANGNEEENNQTQTGDNSLVQSKWGWGGLSLQFISSAQVKFGSTEYGYTYDEETKTGAIDILGSFEYNEETTTLTFTAYKGNSNQRVDFTTLMDTSLVGTKWRWGNSLMEITAGNKLNLRGKPYKYSYDGAVKAGNINGLGEFTIDDAKTKITFEHYKADLGVDYDFQVVFTLSDPDTPVSMAQTLWGTEWYWESIYGGYLTFTTEKNIGGSIRTYTWDGTAKKGFLEVLGPFFIHDDNPNHLTFTNIKGYGHTAEFFLIP